MDVKETHEKILNILRDKGPSLPINIAKELSMSSLFISAFLSELLNEKRIKMSHLKVGGSSLYLLDGQEEQLEPYYKFMHPKEAETFLLLKNNKILKDTEQEPATRVALRSIRDFAVGFKVDEEIYWRYFLNPEEKVNISIEDNKLKEEGNDEIKDFDEKTTEKKEEEIITKEIKENKKTKKQKSKSEFVLKAIDFINKNGLKILNEKDYKINEYNCIIQIRSELGTMNFLTQAKDKKKISETDLMKLLSNAQSLSLPAFMLYTKEISKKAKDYLQKYKSILKVKKID